MLKRAALFLLVLLSIFFANAFLNPIPQKNVPEGFKPSYGVTYSFEQANWYGLDPKKSYIELLDSIDFEWVRLPFFWDQMVDENGNLRLDDLEFAIEEAAKSDVKVVIALGLKTPYYPEYHLPDHIASQVKFGERININHPVADDILEVDKKVVQELSRYANIIFWQVENEPLIGNVNKWKIEPSLIKAEVEVVRKTDPKNRPIILNHAAVGFYDTSWHDLMAILKKGDVFAVNAFFKTKGTDILTAKIFGREIHILWPDHLVWPVHSWSVFSPNFNSIQNHVEKNGNTLWVLEMQAEPYIKKLEEADDPLLTFMVQDIIAGDRFLRSFQAESIGLWGVHFWQHREKLGDPSWIETARSIVNGEY